MKTTIIALALGLVVSGCGYGRAKRDAVIHFSTHYAAIDELAKYFLTNIAIDYVEFRPDNSVDLWVLDKERFDRKTSPALFKYQLHWTAIDSQIVSNALGYASVTKEAFMTLRDLALRAGCISMKKPFWESDLVHIDVGFSRDGMSKTIYRKFKDSENVEDLVSRPPWRDDCLGVLTGQWVLVVGRPAFN